jgi:hypothetical protein
MKERAFSYDLLLQDWSAGNGKSNYSQKSLDQRIGPTHPHYQVENAFAPLRLCASARGLPFRMAWSCHGRMRPEVAESVSVWNRFQIIVSAGSTPSAEGTYDQPPAEGDLRFHFEVQT